MTSSKSPTEEPAKSPGKSSPSTSWTSTAFIAAISGGFGYFGAYMFIAQLYFALGRRTGSSLTSGQADAYGAIWCSPIGMFVGLIVGLLGAILVRSVSKTSRYSFIAAAIVALLAGIILGIELFFKLTTDLKP